MLRMLPAAKRNTSPEVNVITMSIITMTRRVSRPAKEWNFCFMVLRYEKNPYICI